MSNVIQCDICKGTFKTHDVTNHVTVYKYNNSRGKRKELDICDDCLAELGRLIENKYGDFEFIYEKEAKGWDEVCNE